MTDAPLCPETGIPMVRDTRPVTVINGGHTRTIDMPGCYCEESSESIFTREDMKVSDLAIVTLKAELGTN